MIQSHSSFLTNYERLWFFFFLFKCFFLLLFLYFFLPLLINQSEFCVNVIGCLYISFLTQISFLFLLSQSVCFAFRCVLSSFAGYVWAREEHIENIWILISHMIFFSLFLFFFVYFSFFFLSFSIRTISFACKWFFFFGLCLVNQN